MNNAYAIYEEGDKKIRVFANWNDRTKPDDETYDPKRHAGKLRSEDGTLKAQFVKAAASALGDEATGRRAHLRFVKDKTKKNETASQPRYDETAGLRLHINTGSYSELFANEASPYAKDEKGKRIPLSPEMKIMRPWALHTAADFLKTMLDIGPERWKNSVIIHRGIVTPTNEFVVRYGRGKNDHPRFQHLVKRLQDEGGMLPVLMEVQIDQRVIPSNWKDMHVESKEIDGGKDREGRRIKIMPQVTVPYYYGEGPATVNQNARYAFMHGGKHFVLGYVELEVAEYNKVAYYRLKMRVEHPEQIVRSDIDETLKPALKASETAIKTPELS